MTRNEIVIAAHPPYSPDLAPSDFYLLGHVKCLVSGESFETGERLLLAVAGISGSLEKSILTRVFLEWITSSEQFIEINGDYVLYSKINILVVIGFKRCVSRCYISVEHPLSPESCASPFSVVRNHITFGECDRCDGELVVCRRQTSNGSCI
jgi:hypothetical protein